MIRTEQEFKLAREQATRVEHALHSLRREVLPHSPINFETLSEAYLDQLQSLRRQIDDYLVGRQETIRRMSVIEICLDGDGIKLGTTPSRVITSILDSFRRGVQALMEIRSAAAADQASVGRRHKWVEVLSDPPIVAFETGSVRMHLGEPKPTDLFEEQGVRDFYQTVELLTRGISWAATSAEAPPELEIDDLRLKHAVLSAVKKLSPTRDGILSSVTFRGSILQDRAELRLTRDSRIRITAELKRLANTEKYVETTGTIRELDLDRLTFTLRKRDGDDRDLPCTYPEVLQGEVIDYLDQQVLVSGSLRTTMPSGQQTMTVEYIESTDTQ